MGEASTSSREELREELKKLISLLVKQYIRSWYTGLSSNEDLFTILEDLVDELFLKVYERSESADWDCYLQEIVPAIVLRHLEDFNIATDRHHTGQRFAEAFMEVAGKHDGALDQSAYLMRVADGLLAVLLPYDELVSDVAYAFVREVLSEVLLSLYAERLSNVYFWDELLIKWLKKPSRSSDLSSLSRIRHILGSGLHSFWLRISPWIAATGQKHAQTASSGDSLCDTALPRIATAFLAPSLSPLTLSLISNIALPLIDKSRGTALRSLITEEVKRQTTSEALTRHAKWLTNFLFIDGKPSPSKIIPSEATQAVLRIEAKENLALQVPFFADKQVTKILLFRLLDAAITTLLPELARQTPEQIREKRIMIHMADDEAFGQGGISSIIKTRTTVEEEEKVEITRRATAAV